MKRKDKILAISKLFLNKYAFKRAYELHDNNPPDIEIKSYKKFIKYNLHTLKKMEKHELNNIYIISQMIQSNKIKLCDEENMYPARAYSLFFDPNGKLILNNPR